MYQFVDHIVSILDSYGHTYVWAGVGLIAQVFTRYAFYIAPCHRSATFCSFVVRWWCLVVFAAGSCRGSG